MSARVTLRGGQLDGVERPAPAAGVTRYRFHAPKRDRWDERRYWYTLGDDGEWRPSNGTLHVRDCGDCGQSFQQHRIGPGQPRRVCDPCQTIRDTRERLTRTWRYRHGMKSLVANAASASAWAADLRAAMITWDESYQTTLEMYALTLAQIESGRAYIDEQRAEGASMKDLLVWEQLLDTRLRIAIKLAHELGLTPRSAIAMAKDAGTARQMLAEKAAKRLQQHLDEGQKELEAGEGKAA